jgi:LCP family protein required for cell wall assembly
VSEERPAPGGVRDRRLVRRALGAMLAVLAMGGGWWLSEPFRGSASSQTGVGIHKVQGASWRPETGQPLFVAVLGNDNRNAAPGAGGRCDAIHIVAINPQAKAGTILNIARDSFVGGSKINDRCVRGPDAMVGALKALTGMPIQYYVTTEFSHFMAFFSEVGAIEVNVPYAMNDPASGAVFRAGPQQLFGGEILAFTRNRKDTPKGDFSRSDNQGLVILASLAKFRKEAADPHRILDYVKAARRHMKVSIPMSEAIPLALLARDIDPANVRNVTINGRTGSVGAASVVFLEPGDTFQRVRDDGIY